ncbi:LysR substrate-binding domain-containing protein [Serratia sp. L9]|uniref:LysR substrate-binding domain-containing protein n=1 Tax=Serratia sp. L9 TaxID=3423946 RepID=UPI003D67CCFC
MKNIPKLHYLKIFQSIIQHGSIRSAAKSLNQTQPALTRAMNELEKMLGTCLMVRGTRGVILTEAGKLFIPRMQLALNELERAVNELEHISHTARGTVNIGSSCLFSMTVLPLAIQRFQKRFPKVNIHLSEGQIPELLEAVRCGKLDFIIGATLNSCLSNEFIEEHLFTTSFRVLARRGHPLAYCSSLKELRKANWYLPMSSYGYYRHLDTILFPEKQQNMPRVVRGNEALMRLQMVLNADFLTVGAQCIPNVPSLKKLLCYIPIMEILPDGSYSFIYSQRLPLTTVAKNLMSELRKEIENYPWNA